VSRGSAARRLVARAVGGKAADGAALAALRELCGSWRRVERLVDAERLAPLLAFRAHAADLPGDASFREFLNAVSRETLAFNLKFRKLYDEVRGRLAAAGIIALPLKGVDLAFAVYPSPACRPMADVDILVSPDDYDAAQAVLRAAGFVPLRRDPRWWPARLFRRGGQFVDLHWSPAAALPPRRGMASLCYSGYDDAESAKDEFRLLVSVCHHQNHFFALPLLYFWETALLAERVSWTSYLTLARRWGVVRATKFVLALARAFFGGVPSAGTFGFLKTLAAPVAVGIPVMRGARAAASYAFSLDNPAAALASAFRRPAWARRVLTGRAGDDNQDRLERSQVVER